MKFTEKTMAMAQRVRDYIIQHPEKHEQSAWVGQRDRNSNYVRYFGNVNEKNFCNTTMCIAGTAIFLEEGIPGLQRAAGSIDTLDAYNSGWYQQAMPLLGLETDNEAEMLFGNMDNNNAFDMLGALADGDVDKFYAIRAME
jgi:hypothetical protein